jgi:hypothetical protein
MSESGGNNSDAAKVVNGEEGEEIITLGIAFGMTLGLAPMNFARALVWFLTGR